MFLKTTKSSESNFGKTRMVKGVPITSISFQKKTPENLRTGRWEVVSVEEGKVEVL